MEGKNTIGKRYATISDGGESLTFVERVMWSNAGTTESELELLRHYMIIGQIPTTSGFYLALMCMNPMEFHQPEKQYKLARFSVDDETGRIEVHSMNVTAAQIEQLRRAGEWFE